MNNDDTSNQIDGANKCCVTVIIITTDDKDYRGASEGLEVEAAEILWNRSMEQGCFVTPRW